MTNEELLKVLNEYISKMRIDGLNFINEISSELSEIDKDVFLYTIFQNAKINQLNIMKKTYDLNIDDMVKVFELTNEV